MDKTKGVGNQGREVRMAGEGGEWWGKNADNYTQTTIKFKKELKYMTTLMHELDKNKYKVLILSKKGQILLIDRKIKDGCDNLKVNW